VSHLRVVAWIAPAFIGLHALVAAVILALA
jgi:hypothetical protein